MIDKRVLGVLIIFALGLNFVSAYYGGSIASGLGQGMEQVIDIVEEFLSPFFSAILGGDSDNLFERVLFLVIVLASVYMIVGNMEPFKGNEVVIWIISIAVSLLSTRFLVESDLVQTMILPYSVLGVVLTAALPMLIYFFFVQKFSDSAVTRKILWVFFIVAFIGIWGARYDELGDIAWIYFFGAVLAFFFLLFDGTIRRAIIKQEMKELNIDNRDTFIAKINEELGKLNDWKSKEYISEAAYKRRSKKLLKQRKELMKHF